MMTLFKLMVSQQHQVEKKEKNVEDVDLHLSARILVSEQGVSMSINILPIERHPSLGRQCSDHHLVPSAL